MPAGDCRIDGPRKIWRFVDGAVTISSLSDMERYVECFWNKTSAGEAATWGEFLKLA